MVSLQVAEEKGPANSVPAAAVIRKVRALSGIIGFKGSAGGSVSQLLNIRAQLCYAVETIFLEYAQGWRNSIDFYAEEAERVSIRECLGIY